MRVFKVKSIREFFTVFMEVQSIRYKFNDREISLATEFLYHRNLYTAKPIKIQVIEERNGEDEVVEIVPDMMTQLKDTRTLHEIKKNLEMSNTILRKHVKGLKDKGFFQNGDIHTDFLTDGMHVAFTIQQ